MDTTETAAAKAIIGRLLSGFLSLQSKITQATVDAYMDAVRDVTLEAVAGAYEDYRSNKVPDYDPRYGPPNAIQFGERCRLNQRGIDYLARKAAQIDGGARPAIVSYPIGGKPPEGYQPLGWSRKGALVA